MQPTVKEKVGPQRRTLVSLWRTAIVLLIGIEILAMYGKLNIQPLYTGIGLIVTASVTWALIEWVEHYTHRRNNGLLPWWMFLLLLIGLYLDAIGDLWKLYIQFEHYDSMLHITISFAVALVLFELLSLQYQQLSLTQLIGIGSSIAITIGVFIEIDEYLEDLFTGSNRIGEGFDTANDLFCNTTGVGLAAILFITFFFFYKKRASKTQA